MLATEAAPKLTHNEIIKEGNPTLAGAIASTLKDPNVDRFSEDDVQFLQFHGVAKTGLGALVKGINESLLSTLAACGDVNRNVMAPPTPANTRARQQVFEHCHAVALALAPKTKAYH